LNFLVNDAAASRITEYGMPIAVVIVSGVICFVASESEVTVGVTFEVKEYRFAPDVTYDISARSTGFISLSEI